MDGLKNIVSDTKSDDQQMVDTPLLIEANEPDGMTSLTQDSPKISKPFYNKAWFLILLGFLLLFGIIFSWVAYVGYSTFTELKTVQTHALGVRDAFTTRNLSTANDELSKASASLDKAYSTYKQISPLGNVWPFKGYVADGNHLFVTGQKSIEVARMVIDSITPYADLLGFTGNSNQDLNFTTAEERIVFVATTVEKLAPEMDKLSAKLKEIDIEIQGINENRYPKKLGDLELRNSIVEGKKTVNTLASSLQNFQPIIKLLPDLLGNPEPKKYLILFQNDAELRPTGGFLTAYATLSILKGKITPGVSEDIYTLDAGFKKKVPAPDPIKKYLPLVYNWNLRDMNLSPDFKVSMDTFTTHMQDSTAKPEYDAIIAIDTEVPVRILKVLGPIGVPGYGGKFSAENDPRCDCPQVIYELENIITKPTYEIREGRKSILGPLMNSMLANMMGSPKAKWAEFFNIFTQSIKEKHLLMYFKDEQKQNAAEVLGAAGRINSYTGDYLHINDTNFAGAKSNLFVESEVVQDITINNDGSLTKKLTLTYRNPRKGDNCNLEAGQLCLNGLLRDWIRLYVPMGSTLKMGRGFESDMVTNTDLGYTVLEGFFTLAPQSVKKLEVEYTTPAGTIKDNYNLLIQKQPGVDPVKHTINISGSKPKVYTIDSDQEIIISR